MGFARGRPVPDVRQLVVARQVSKCSVVNVSDVTHSGVDFRVVVLDSQLVLFRGLRPRAHNLKECCILAFRSDRLGVERVIKGCSLLWW
jgi:hypothetical protein